MGLTLVPIGHRELDAELDLDKAALAALLEVTVEEWPPEGGEWDRDAARFFREQVDRPEFDPNFGPYYVVRDGLLVGSAGFFGAPGEQGEVEIGYSVCATQRRLGIATEVVGLLCDLAASSGASGIRARTNTANQASIRVLHRNGFAVDEQSVEATDDSVLLRKKLVRATCR